MKVLLSALQAGKAIKISDKKEKPTTECFEVTGMEPNRRRLILLDGMNRTGFSAFIKHTHNNQTYYVFIYNKAL